MATLRGSVSQRYPMTFDLTRILESKRAHRQQLASRPVGEKLRMLDALRERELAIRGRVVPSDPAVRVVREERKPYRTEPE
jgi:hypothetical protein